MILIRYHNKKFFTTGAEPSILYLIGAILFQVPMYNRADPKFLGLPFFYWFQGLWLFIATVMYVIAVLLLSKDDEQEEVQK